MDFKVLLVFSSLLLEAGCAGIGVVASSDPAMKLRDAQQLYDRQDRPLLAEYLIREAADIYEKRGDQLGLAEAYRQYGFFFRSSSVSGKLAEAYRREGFLDPTATFDTRYQKSLEYFEKSRTLYDASGKADLSTNVSLNMGFTYLLMDNRAAACRELARSLTSSELALRTRPDAPMDLPQGFTSFQSYISDLEKRYNCPEGTPSR